MHNRAKLSLLPLAVAVTSLMLSACGGGGSFNNPSTITVGHSQIIESAQPSDATADNHTNTNDKNDNASDTNNDADSPLLTPVLGSAIAIPKRNQAYNGETITPLEEHKPIDEASIEAAHSDPLPILRQRLQALYANSPIYQNEQNYQFVKAGWIFSALYPDETIETHENGKLTALYTKGDGYLYYFGDNPTTGRTKGVANYTGHWDFATDVKRVRDRILTDSGVQTSGGGAGYGMDNRFGDDVGATSFAEQVFGQVSPRQGNHRATFTADFDNKTLSGTLATKKKAAAKAEESYIDRYDITANIKGNRFTGSAIAKNSDPKFNLFSQNADNRLEGGFFGDNAEELVGKFLSNDNSVFAVFAGKQDNPATLEKAFDGVYVELTQDPAINPAQKAQVLTLNNFGNVNQLKLGEHTIALLPQKDGQITQQTVTLATGQTAVITSFGSSDGKLRLGLVSKTAKVSTSTDMDNNTQNTNQDNNQANTTATPSADELDAAKQKLIAQVDALKEELSVLIVSYQEGEEEDKTTTKEKITELALSGYQDADEKSTLTMDLHDILARLDEGDETGEVLDEILDIFTLGEKYDAEDENNLQEFLAKNPPKPAIPSYTDNQISNAKAELQAQLATQKQSLTELLEVFVIESESLASVDGENGDIANDNADDGERANGLDELKTLIVQQIINAYTDAHHANVSERVQTLLEELQAGDETVNTKLLALLAGGDKFDGENLANLTAYLPALDDGNAGNQPVNVSPIGIDDSLTGLYLLGERTPISQMPVQGQANYQGTWHGKIGHHWQSQAGYGEYDGKANFAVDFGDKSLTGTLTEKSGVEPAFDLSAKISGNSFSGTATSRSQGINLDAGRQQNQQILPVTASDNLTGAFYGDNAKHLGGSFSFENALTDGTKVVGGAVFYGTKSDNEDK